MFKGNVKWKREPSFWLYLKKSIPLSYTTNINFLFGPHTQSEVEVEVRE